jgi:hypothetical protein
MKQIHLYYWPVSVKVKRKRRQFYGIPKFCLFASGSGGPRSPPAKTRRGAMCPPAAKRRCFHGLQAKKAPEGPVNG